MQTVTTIGFVIAKSIFQVQGVDASGQVVGHRAVEASQVIAFFQKLSACLVGIEACASSHYWWRELQVLGHSMRLVSKLRRPLCRVIDDFCNKICQCRHKCALSDKKSFGHLRQRSAGASTGVRKCAID